MLLTCEEYAKRNRFRFNPQKCEVVHNGPRGQAFQLCGANLQVSKFFKYLGIEVDTNGIVPAIFTSRLAGVAERKFHKLASAGLNARGWPLGSRLMTFKTFVMPVYEYGLALLMNKGKVHVARLQGVQNRCLAKCLGVPISSSHLRTHSMAEFPTVETRMQDLARRWLNQ